MSKGREKSLHDKGRKDLISGFSFEGCCAFGPKPDILSRRFHYSWYVERGVSKMRGGSHGIW
ncbi:MAG: hypothetical protein AMS17_02650 [Spirochaetes bacterium DG_61]|nr:MAG: hypothetical protein AMS17_02650 [Spirochaetes bacterium DG_61]